jgi:hypothetical protein
MARGSTEHSPAGLSANSSSRYPDHVGHVRIDSEATPAVKSLIDPQGLPETSSFEKPERNKPAPPPVEGASLSAA